MTRALAIVALLLVLAYLRRERYVEADPFREPWGER